MDGRNTSTNRRSLTGISKMKIELESRKPLKLIQNEIGRELGDKSTR